ncbi:MAG: transposase domain-containing protein [Spirochaetia bacterium]
MTLYSLIETTKANNAGPYWYLRRLFDCLPTFDTDDDYENLLPWRIFSEEAEDPPDITGQPDAYSEYLLAFGAVVSSFEGLEIAGLWERPPARTFRADRQHRRRPRRWRVLRSSSIYAGIDRSHGQVTGRPRARFE